MNFLPNSVRQAPLVSSILKHQPRGWRMQGPRTHSCFYFYTQTPLLSAPGPDLELESNHSILGPASALLVARRGVFVHTERAPAPRCPPTLQAT